MKYGNRSATRFRRIANSPFTVILLFILSFVLIKAAWNIHEKSKLTEERLRRTQTEIAKLEERHAILNKKVALLSTDEGVEAEMRTKYRAVKDGELVAVIIDEENTALALTPVSDVGIWQKLLHWIGLGK